MPLVASPTDTQLAPFAVELAAITKTFGVVIANNAVSLQIVPASIHGIVGENGAGKSTLMSILYGFYPADSGTIKLHGVPVSIENSFQAIRAGIGMVHQHFMLVATLTALDNIILGYERTWLLVRARNRVRPVIEEIMSRYQLWVDLDCIVAEMNIGEQQRLEILKALYRQAQILILDEPTGVLTPQEASALFNILRQLKLQGMTVILITHKLQEIIEITDNVTVMRAGKVVAHKVTAQTNRKELAQLMVDRLLSIQHIQHIQQKRNISGKPLLKLTNLCYTDARGIARFHNINLAVRAGEIVGIAGVVGNGQSELLAAMVGLCTPSSGTMETIIDGVHNTYTTEHWIAADKLRDNSCAHVPEDRLAQGIIKNFSMAESAILGYHEDQLFGKGMQLSPMAVNKHANELIHSFDIRPKNNSLKTANMSGGNQQKLILAREMFRNPQILLIGQPTRGVDVGAIEQIYQALRAARDEGAAILVISVELEEIFDLADTIVVMNEGRITGTSPTCATDIPAVGLLMTQSATHG